MGLSGAFKRQKYNIAMMAMFLYTTYLLKYKTIGSMYLLYIFYLKLLFWIDVFNRFNQSSKKYNLTLILETVIEINVINKTY